MEDLIKKVLYYLAWGFGIFALMVLIYGIVTSF